MSAVGREAPPGGSGETEASDERRGGKGEHMLAASLLTQAPGEMKRSGPALGGVGSKITTIIDVGQEQLAHKSEVQIRPGEFTFRA